MSPTTNALNITGRLLILAMPLLLNDFYLLHVSQENIKLNIILDLLVYVFWQGSIVFLAYKAKWFNFSDLGIHFKNLKKQISIGFVFTVLAILISILILVSQRLIQKYTGIVLAENWYYPPNPNWQVWQAGMYVIYLAVSAGIFEEIVYRGIAISQLKKISQNTLFLVASSTFLFVIIHWSNGMVTWIQAAIFGSFWAYSFIKTGRLLPIMIAHFLYNLCYIYGLQKYIMGFFKF